MQSAWIEPKPCQKESYLLNSTWTLTLHATMVGYKMIQVLHDWDLSRPTKKSNIIDSTAGLRRSHCIAVTLRGAMVDYKMMELLYDWDLTRVTRPTKKPVNNTPDSTARLRRHTESTCTGSARHWTKANIQRFIEEYWNVVYRASNSTMPQCTRWCTTNVLYDPNSNRSKHLSNGNQIADKTRTKNT